MKSALSPLIAGTMTWGAWGKRYSIAQMIELIEVYCQNNITTFDHADIYGGHTTEIEFGKAFKASGISRKEIQLITKCGIKYPSEVYKYPLKQYDYRAEYIVSSAENSLKNLQTEYLDVFLLHRPSPLMNTDEISKAVEKLQKEGKIGSFGVSNFTNSQTELIQQKTKILYNQIQFSATHFQAMLDGSLDFMQIQGIQPMAWNPLGSFFTLPNLPLEETINSIAKQYEVTNDIILLAWILKHPAHILPVVGTAQINRISRLTQALSISLTEEEWFRIWTESMGKKIP